MGILRFDDLGRIATFEEKPLPQRLAEIGGSIPKGSTAGGTSPEKPFVASMGIYVFSREVLLDILDQPGVDFGKEIIPKALGTHRVNRYIFRGYWADVGTIEAFYDANIQLTKRGAPFNFFHPRWPIYTHRGSCRRPAPSMPASRTRLSRKAATWISAPSPTRWSAFAPT